MKESFFFFFFTLTILSLTLLVACGGGGGSASTTIRTPTTMPPPANLESLPNFLAAQNILSQDLNSLRSRFTGTVPTITDDAQIISGIQTTATATDTIIMQNIVVPGLAGVTGTPITPDCSANTSCTANIPNVGMNNSIRPVEVY